MATLKTLMTILSKEGMLENRAELINSYTGGRTSSARGLYLEEINELCDFFQSEHRAKMDKKRKRLIAAIFGFYQKANKKVSMNYVLSTACRAAKVKSFNEIPATRLDSLYAAFLKAQKDLEFSTKLVEGVINEKIFYN